MKLQLWLMFKLLRKGERKLYLDDVMHCIETNEEMNHFNETDLSKVILDELGWDNYYVIRDTRTDQEHACIYLDDNLGKTCAAVKKFFYRNRNQTMDEQLHIDDLMKIVLRDHASCSMDDLIQVMVDFGHDFDHDSGCFHLNG